MTTTPPTTSPTTSPTATPSTSSPLGQAASPLSAQMREGSLVEHRAAEGSHFMARMLDGQVDRKGYAAYLSRLRRVYDALEQVGERLAADPVAAAVVDRDLFRVAAIDADLAFWKAPAAVLSPATDAYVARIEASASAPHRYLAHHYTRYLGDLSGGQAVGRIISRTFTLPDGLGVQFYRFAAVPKPKRYKDAYRARMDALELTEREQAEVVEEVRAAFALNQAVFDELGHEHR